MKKLSTLVAAIVLAVGTASAQNIANHLGVGLGVGTEGINVNVATPVTKFLEVSAGVSVVPGIKPDFDVDVSDINFDYMGQHFNIPMDKVNIKADFARTMFDVKLNVYPFGGSSAFFLAGGASFGGEKIAKLTGHSDDVRAFMQRDDYPQAVKDKVFAEIDKYEVKFDNNGDINGDVRVKNFRPYVGLGFGRLVPKHHVGARFELGCHFMGNLKVYQNDKEVNIGDFDTSDDLSKLIDKLTVYPVLKITIQGRIF